MARSIAVAPGKITPLAVSCPRGAAAVTGGVSRYLPGVLTLRSRPQGSGTWQFRLLSPDGNDRGTVSVSVACVRTEATTVVRSLPSRSTARGTLSCPSGLSPAGLGWDFGPPQDAFDGFLGWVIRKIDPGWKIVADDLAADSRSPSGPLKLSGRCVRASVKNVTFTASVRDGDRTVERSCPGGGSAVGGGFSVRGDQWLEGFGLTSAHSGRWTIFNRGPRASRIRLTLVCMS